MTSIEKLPVHVFSSSKVPFQKLLQEENIEHQFRPIPPGKIFACGETIEIIKAVGVASISPALASVIVRFIKNRSTREITIQTLNKKIFNVKGYSVEEIQKLLEMAENITVIETKKTNTRVSGQN